MSIGIEQIDYHRLWPSRALEETIFVHTIYCVAYQFVDFVSMCPFNAVCGWCACVLRSTHSGFSSTSVTNRRTSIPLSAALIP